VLVNKSARPSLDWLSIAHTSSAKHKIKQWFRKERKHENVAIGQEAVERELTRAHMRPDLAQGDTIERIAKRMNHASAADLFAAIGFGDASAPSVVTRLREESKGSNLIDLAAMKRMPAPRGARCAARTAFASPMSMTCSCVSPRCSPVPGDPIMGYVTIGKGVSVHRGDCPNVAYMSATPERILQASWINLAESTHAVDVEVDALDRAGLLQDVMAVCAEYKTNASSVTARVKRDSALISLTLQINDLAHLHRVLENCAHCAKCVTSIGSPNAKLARAAKAARSVMMWKAMCVLSCAAVCLLPVAGAADEAPTYQGPQNAAETAFVRSIQGDLMNRFATAHDAERAGYVRYTNEDDTGAISYANQQWQSTDIRHPEPALVRCAWEATGRRLSVLKTSNARPHRWGINPGRWYEFEGHTLRGAQSSYGNAYHDKYVMDPGSYAPAGTYNILRRKRLSECTGRADERCRDDLQLPKSVRPHRLGQTKPKRRLRGEESAREAHLECVNPCMEQSASGRISSRPTEEPSTGGSSSCAL
jgi:hypothetical protein